MFLNPLMMIILAGVSLLGGTIGLIQTENWLSIVPFVFFTFLFCLSLFRPVPKRALVQASYRPVPKPRKQLSKLTADRLGLLRAMERPHTPAFRT